jgi:hypothetical protein
VTPDARRGAGRVRFARVPDLPSIQAVYAHARTRQQALGGQSWPEFPAIAILTEIDRKRLLCVDDGRMLAGVFSIAYEDGALWGTRERGDHVYLHRIAKAAGCHVDGFLSVVLRWATDHCQELGRSGLRMDTWASNAGLIGLHEFHGFRVVDRVHVEHDARLPAQYQRNNFVLLEQADR